MNRTAEKLIEYLYNVLYNPDNAEMDVSELPEDFQGFGTQLRNFAGDVIEAKTFIYALSQGELKTKIPRRSNEIALPLRALHAALRHITLQMRQVAKGDLSQRMLGFGDFAEEFNAMVQQLEERESMEMKERSYLQHYINLILANMPDLLIVFDNSGHAVLSSNAYIQTGRFSTACGIRGKTFRELFESVASDALLHEMDILFARIKRDKEAVNTVCSLDIGRRGMLRIYNIRVIPMLYENDVVIGTMVVLHDLTDTVQAKA